MNAREVIARAIAEAEACHPDDWQHFTEQADAALSAYHAHLEAAGMAPILDLFVGLLNLWSKFKRWVAR